MRALASLVAAIGTLIATAHSQQPKASGTIAEVRRALGGEAALAAVTSFSADAVGQYRFEYGSTSYVRYSVRVDCQFPDKFLVTRMQAEGGRSLSERDGINANELIRQTIVAPPRQPPERLPGVPADTPESKAAERSDQLLRVKQWFAAFTLLLFVRSTPAYPLDLRDAGSADLQGAHVFVIEGRASSGSIVRLFVDPVSLLPVVVSWHGTPRPPDAPGLLTLMPRATGADALEPAPIEYQLSAGDYRLERGFRWPHLLIVDEGGRDIEELNVRAFRINPQFSADRFKPFE